MNTWNLAKQLGKALKEWQIAGRPVVSKEVLKDRLLICQGCEHWQEIAGSKIARCRKCGCSSAKLLMGTSQCPLTPPKWEKVKCI